MRRPETPQFGNNPAADIELLKRIRAEQNRQELKQDETGQALAVVVCGAIVAVLVACAEYLWS